MVVQITGDALYEGASEDLAVICEATMPDLSKVTTSVAIVIQDDDSPPTMTAPAVVEVQEGSSGTTAFDIPVSLNAPAGVALTLKWATAGGTAAPPGDFPALSGTLTLAPGETAATITAQVAGDGLQEGNETFSVVIELFNSLAAPALQSVTTSVKIIDDDVPPPVLPKLVVSATLSAPEGNGSTVVTVPVSLTAPAAADWSLELRYSTTGGNATAGSDYTAASGTIPFAAGDVNKTISITLQGDSAQEGPESIVLFLELVAFGGATQADNKTVTIVLKDDDKLLAQIYPAKQTVTEGAANENTNTTAFVVLTAQPPSDVIVNYTTRDITAKAGEDYTATAGALTFTPANWDAPQAVVVPITGGDPFEVNEQFAIDIKVMPPFEGILDPKAKSATITIKSKLPPNATVGLPPLSLMTAPEAEVIYRINRKNTVFWQWIVTDAAGDIIKKRDDLQLLKFFRSVGRKPSRAFKKYKYSGFQWVRLDGRRDCSRKFPDRPRAPVQSDKVGTWLDARVFVQWSGSNGRYEVRDRRLSVGCYKIRIWWAGVEVAQATLEVFK
ncbi:MAG: hypothetical protein J3K34DRAFT_417026 [Monoraphidium minutum]|nr:MAG: hypothetical protein J3K34DRAFT_417026 [Monoraphidium minutum]